MDFSKVYKLEYELCDVCFRDTVSHILREPDKHLVSYAVRKYGRNNVKRLIYATASVEQCGGMLRKDGTRRRTPGGTFAKLAKFTFRRYKNGEFSAPGFRIVEAQLDHVSSMQKAILRLKTEHGNVYYREFTYEGGFDGTGTFGNVSRAVDIELYAIVSYDTVIIKVKSDKNVYQYWELNIDYVDMFA